MATITLAFIARKGGVGKSTSCISIGAEYSRRGLKTCLLDLDPQASLTDSFRLGPATGTAADLFGDGLPTPTPTAFPNLSVLPGSELLDPFNVPDFGGAGALLFAVRDFLNADFVVRTYDMVLIDCPPNLYLLSMAAMVGASYVLTPTRADRYGADALQVVNAAVASVQAGSNPGLVQLGFLLSAHKARNAIHGAYSTLLRQQWPGLVLGAAVPDAAAFGEAADMQTPIGILKPRSAAAKAVGAVVDELEQRMEQASERRAA